LNLLSKDVYRDYVTEGRFPVIPGVLLSKVMASATGRGEARDTAASTHKGGTYRWHKHGTGIREWEVAATQINWNRHNV